VKDKMVYSSEIIAEISQAWCV